jgi:hypothetical protein
LDGFSRPGSCGFGQRQRCTNPNERMETAPSASDTGTSATSLLPSHYKESGLLQQQKNVAIDAVLWQYGPIATKWHSLASVAIKCMVIGCCSKNVIVATKCSITTTMWEVATFFPVATITYLHDLVCRDCLMQHATESWRLPVCGDRHLWQ